jgi:hypothetical protein
MEHHKLKELAITFLKTYYDLGICMSFAACNVKLWTLSCSLKNIRYSWAHAHPVDCRILQTVGTRVSRIDNSQQ